MFHVIFFSMTSISRQLIYVFRMFSAYILNFLKREKKNREKLFRNEYLLLNKASSFHYNICYELFFMNSLRRQFISKLLKMSNLFIF